MTTRIRITHDQSEGHTLSIHTIRNGSAAPSETMNLCPGQSGEFHVHSTQFVVIEELEPVENVVITDTMPDALPPADAYPGPSEPTFGNGNQELVIETKTYDDGTTATGVAPLPDESPVGSADSEYEQQFIASSDVGSLDAILTEGQTPD